MASSNAPRQLNINCTVSAVFLPEQGSIFGYHSRYKQQIDPANTLSATFYEQIERNKYSPKLSNFSTGAGGLIPTLNLFIGAPAATFGEGAIVPNEAHPALNLLSGATSSVFNPGLTYTLPANAKSSNPRFSSEVLASSSQLAGVFSFGSFPFIPTTKIGPFASLTPRKTYNIWQQKFVEKEKLTFLKNFGVTNYKVANGAALSTTTNATGSKITVHSQNRSSVIRRFFPIADDMLYEEPTIYYPSINGITKSPEVVKAKGGPNCGFWLHFDVTPPTRKVKSNTTSTSEIFIYWGYPNEQEAERRITEFVLILSPGQPPSLRYKRPGDQTNNTLKSIRNNWNKVDLRGTTFDFGRSFKIDIFIHYAGSNMYIGFTPEVAKWNVFEPIRVTQLTEESSDDAYYVPYQPEKSVIEVYLNDVAVSFTYSPLCFNNFNSEFITETSQDTRNRVLIDFNVPQKEYLSGSCSPEKIIKNFISARKPNFEVLTAGTGGTVLNSPTFYGDWRRTGKSEEEYAAAPEFSYEELSRTTDNSIEDNVRVLVRSQISYETTIEGPVFFYLRNFPEAPQRQQITRNIWGNYSDISAYLTSANVSVSYDTNENRSYKTSTAQLTFANLTNDLIGIQILNAIQENVLVFTLKAGYENNIKTFFQGISKSVRVVRSPDGFTVIISCQDIGDKLLSDLRFNTTNSLSFALSDVGSILKDCFFFAGLEGTYKPREERAGALFDPLYDKYFKFHIGAQGLQFPNSLASSVITVNKTIKIASVIQKLLSVMNYTIGDPFTVNDSLPVFYWNPDKHKFIISLRSDETQDTLFFAGDTSDPSGIQYLANNNPLREHGIVDSSGWTETTSMDSLHSKFIFSTTLFDLTPFFKESPPDTVNKALSTEAYNELNKFVQNPATNDSLSSFQNQPVVGYVGYNKELLKIDDPTVGFYQNENLAKEIFLIRQKFIRETFTAISLNVLVTQPLNDSGLFTIKSFEGGAENETDKFIYKNINYQFDVENNIIRANIEGERFPDFIGE